MKTFLKAILATALTFGFAAFASAGEAKTYEGAMQCAKCELGTAEKCADTLKVDEVVYNLEDAEGKRKTEWHQCKGTVNAKVTGAAEERDGEQYIVVTNIEKMKGDDKEES